MERHRRAKNESRGRAGQNHQSHTERCALFADAVCRCAVGARHFIILRVVKPIIQVTAGSGKFFAERLPCVPTVLVTKCVDPSFARICSDANAENHHASSPVPFRREEQGVQRQVQRPPEAQGQGKLGRETRRGPKARVASNRCADRLNTARILARSKRNALLRSKKVGFKGRTPVLSRYCPCPRRRTSRPCALQLMARASGTARFFNPTRGVYSASAPVAGGRQARIVVIDS